jgi:thioredoxin 1
MMKTGSIAATLILAALPALAQRPFTPLEEWKAAVVDGDQTALSRQYSVKPEAVTQAGKDRVALQDELVFWAGLKARGLTDFNPRLLEITTVKGATHLVLRVSANLGGSRVYTSMRQVWAHGAGGWRMVASRRNAFIDDPTRVLPQPASPNTSLYSDPRDAEEELKAALVKAGVEGKRVIVVFGGNWCYDCHVLDTTFHSSAFAPLVDANFVVVHINIGDDGKENHDIAARLGVALDKGVPSLGVLEPSGKVMYAQKNGEFEATEKIGPEDVRAFLEKWKPGRG